VGSLNAFFQAAHRTATVLPDGTWSAICPPGLARQRSTRLAPTFLVVVEPTWKYLVGEESRDVSKPRLASLAANKVRPLRCGD